MTTDRETEMLDKQLAMLRASVPKLIGVLVASVDGRPLAGDLAGLDTRSTAAMAAALLGLGQRVGNELGPALLEEVTVRTGDGVVAVYSANRQAALVILAPAGVNMGLLNHYGRSSARVISTVMRGLGSRGAARLRAGQLEAPSPSPHPDLTLQSEVPIKAPPGPVSDPVTTPIEARP